MVIGESRSVIFRMTNDPMKINAMARTSAIRCTLKSVNSPKRRPLPVVFAPFTAVLARKPVISIPTAPPTPWQGNTSSVSSREVLDFQLTTTLLISAAMVPINKLEGTVTNPAAGVIATSPTTAPIQNPSAEGFLPRTTSKSTQHNPAAAEAVFVVANADAARGPAPKALPALNPNQPNHNRPVPKRTNGMLAGD